MGAVIVIGSFVVIACLVIGVASYLTKKRREEMEAFARRKGFEFAAEKTGQELANVASLNLFNRGRRRTMTNIMRSSAGSFGLAVFDYRYTTGSGKNSHTYIQTIFLFSGSGLRLPAFEMCPENFLTRVIEAFGFQDIDFPDHPQFSKNYLLRGQDEMAIRKLFNSGPIDFFDKRPGLAVAGQGDSIILYWPDRLTKTDEIEPFLNEARQAVELFERSSR